MNREKKPIKPIRILKKPTSSVQFRFYKPETEKSELNRTQTEPNRFEPVFVLKKLNQTETGFGSVFFKKI